MRLVLTNANLIDAVTPGVTAGASVTVEGERIVEVLDGRRSPATRNNPLDDVDNVRTLQLVVKGGRLVADHRGR